ncbi:MAG: YciI family protein [Planctomycetaceae bacterium]
MRVMVIVKANQDTEAGVMPSEELLAEMGSYNEELVKAGIMLAGDGLKPTSAAKRVAFDGDKKTVIDGPFAETKELIAGFWIWQVDSMEQAVEWLKKAPFKEGELDIRPVFEMEDFGEEFTPELRERESKVLSQASLRSATVTPYLFFGGRCEEALDFYEKAVGAIVRFKLQFNESPDSPPEGMLQEGFENKVMHCEFSVGQTTLMGSDGCNDASNFEGFRLALTTETTSDAEKVFASLAEGGTVDMPLMKTFFSPLYGQVTDKFGLGWMVMVPGEPV